MSDWTDISRIPTQDLLKEVAGRPDLTDAGVMTKELFDIIVGQIPILCVDVILVRFENGRIEAGFITRNTGFYKGRYWMVGGRVRKNEGLEQALQRHVQETLGVRPKGLAFSGVLGQYLQDLVEAEQLGFGHEPAKHAVAPICVATLEVGELVFGSTAHGGQEASALHWFSVLELPPADCFCYGGYGFIRAALDSPAARQFFCKIKPIPATV